MRCIVTGAAGFLGSHLSDRLIARGYKVIGVDDFCTGNAENLAHLLNHPAFKFLEHDVIEPLKVEGPIDWIFHFACPASPPKYLQMPIATLRVMAEGTRHLLDLALEKNARFMVASTSEVYGDPLVHPQPESYWGHVNPVGVRSVYDEAKRYAEALVMAYHRTHGLSIRLPRFFNTYGPRMDPADGRIVMNFITQALAGQPLTVFGDGSQTRSFQYVDDLMAALMLLMDTEHCAPINLGNPVEYTMLEVAQIIQDELGTRVPLAFSVLPTDDPRQRKPDISLAKQLLGWAPKTPFRQGLAMTAAHYRTSMVRTS